MIVDVFDIGNNVLCDGCGLDYTESNEGGGLLFGNSAYCPTCAFDLKKSAAIYGEEDYIQAECPAAVSFGDWVRRIRGHNKVIIETLD